MYPLEKALREAYQLALKSCFGEEINSQEVLLRPTPKHFQGHFTFTLHAFAKRLKNKSLAQVGEEIGNKLQQNEAIEGYEFIQGFLNVWLKKSTWQKAAAELVDRIPKQQKQHILIEYSSPNTNKPLHLGHMRNIFLGDALTRILSACGHECLQVSLLNDRGIHICKSIVAYEKEGQHEKPSQKCKGDHLIGKYYVRFEQIFQQEVAELKKRGLTAEEAATNSPIMESAKKMLRNWEAGDKEVRRRWKELNAWVVDGFEKTYKRLGIRFDRTYLESETYLLGKDMVKKGLEQGLFTKKQDGAITASLEKEGLGEKVLLRADGTSLYITQDLGTARLKYEDWPFSASLYVVGDEQQHHFKVLFALLEQLWGGNVRNRPVFKHISYGMVDLPSGKMKSREGTVVDADQLLDKLEEMVAAETEVLGKAEEFSQKAREKLHKKLSLGAIRYFLLKVQAKKRILFDPAASLDLHGMTGIFVQYTHARISAVLRQAECHENIARRGGSPTKELKRTKKALIQLLKFYPEKLPYPEELEPVEQALISQLLFYPRQLEAAAASYDPSVVAQYIYEVARCYNRWYETHPILKKEVPIDLQIWRLWLCVRTKWCLKHGLNVLGIAALGRM